MCPMDLKMQRTITFSNFRKKLATEMKISSFFRKWVKQTRDYLIFNA
jgi:hypothetical protein